MPKTFLVSIHSGPTVPVQGEADDERARAIFELMAANPEQGRVVLRWDEELADVAVRRCASQAREGWEGHTDLSGRGPNFWIRNLTTYELPGYGTDDNANNCESLCHGGDGGYQQVWDAWMGSKGHRIHVLGLDSHYAAQICIGVGYYHLEASEHGHYWCVLTVHPEPD